MTGKTQWTEKWDDAFNNPKQKLTNSPVLISPDPNKLFILSSDASQIAIGATLEQRQANGYLLGVVGYFLLGFVVCQHYFLGWQLNFAVVTCKGSDPLRVFPYMIGT